VSNTEFIDLALADAARLDLTCTICIVGAGAVGIYLATNLAASGKDVVLIEAGGARSGTGESIGFNSLFDALTYHGATKGRLFGIGGTTAIWGGALAPFTRLDLRENDTAHAWRHIVAAANAHSQSVLARLRYRGEGQFLAASASRLGAAFGSLAGAGIDTLSALWLPFKLKNFSWLLAKSFGGPGRLRVVYGAVTTKWDAIPSTSSQSLFLSVNAVARSGKLLNVRGADFVIAAGALESARILLEMNGEVARPLVRSTSAVGQFLADHLSFPVADVAPESLELTRKGGYTPFFQNGWMRNPRFVLSNQSPDQPRAFAHFIAGDRGAGFELARTFLTARQSRSLPKVALGTMIAGAGGLVNLAFARYCKSELFVPRGTPLHLQLDLEQRPVASNRVTLANAKDAYGRRVAKVTWRIHSHDLTNVRLVADRMLAAWPSSSAGVPRLVSRQIEMLADKPYDTYHPTGVCRMGSDQGAVVNLDLKVWGTQNLWQLSTGVFPSAGTTNPTFSLLCLAELLGERLLGSRPQ